MPARCAVSTPPHDESLPSVSTVAGLCLQWRRALPTITAHKIAWPLGAVSCLYCGHKRDGHSLKIAPRAQWSITKATLLPGWLLLDTEPCSQILTRAIASSAQSSWIPSWQYVVYAGCNSAGGAQTCVSPVQGRRKQFKHPPF